MSAQKNQMAGLFPNLETLSLQNGESFQIPNLVLPNKTDNLGPSLSDFASNHLDNGQSGEAASLLDIANLHLTGKSEGTFEIPSLFGTSSSQINEPKIIIPNIQSSKPAVAIDLSIALAPSKPSKPLKEKSPTPILEDIKLPKNTIESDLLVQEEFWNKENFVSKNSVRDSSTLGKVVCRRWRPKVSDKPYLKFKDSTNELKPFLFDSDSPDDKVRQAQSQSFTRRK